MSQGNDSRKRLRARPTNEFDSPLGTVKGHTSRGFVSKSKTSSASSSPPCNSPPPSPWQLPSSSHCVACGKISCSCRGRIDPEEKRRRLEKLRLNTPYERAKALRLTDEVQAEEKKRRGVVESEWMNETKKIAITHTLLFSVVDCVQSERGSRLTIEEEENRRRQECERCMLQDRCVREVNQTEFELRLLLLNVESCERFDLIMKLRAQELLFQKEHEERCKAEKQEFIEREEKCGRFRQQVSHLHAWYLETRRLGEIWKEGQDMLYQAWKEHEDKLMTNFREFIQAQKEHEEERLHFVHSVVQAKVDIRKTEEIHREQLYQSMQKSKEIVLDKLCKQQEERTMMCQDELQRRTDIQMTWTKILDDLRRQHIALRDAVTMVEEKRKECLQLEMNKILRDKKVIQMEEIKAFGELLVKEREEREDCIRWIKEKELCILNFAEWCFNQKNTIVQQENDSRKALLQNISDHYDFWIQWDERKVKQQNELLRAECDARIELESNEHNSFFDLYHLRGEAESIVIRRQVRKREERGVIMHDEERVRRVILMQEDQERETIFLDFSYLLDEVRTHIATISHELQDLILREASLRGTITGDEAQHRKGLITLFRRALEDVRDVQFHRLYCQLETEEAQQRVLIALEERTGRSRLTDLHLIRLEWHDSMQANRNQSALNEMKQEECIERSGIEHREELIRKSIIEEMNQRVQASSASCTDSSLCHSVTQLLSTTETPMFSAFREDLVRQTLTGLTCALGYHDIMYASQLIEGLSECRSNIQTQKRKSAMMAEESAGHADVLERVLEEKRDQKDRYSSNCKRDREHLDRLEGDLKKFRKRFKMEVEVKQKELVEAEKQLQNDNTAMEVCKDIISSKLSGSEK